MPSTKHTQYEDDNMSESSDNTFGHRDVQSTTLFAMDPMSQRYIISAITGQRFHCQNTGDPIKQNSLPSKQLWSVMDCTAPNGSKDPVKLYYDTPEQYERHRHVKVPRKLKESWRKQISELGYNPFGVNNSDSVSKTEVTIVK